MSSDSFNTAMANRSLRTVKSELEFLADSNVISQQQLNTILSNLPESGGARNSQPVTQALGALSLTRSNDNVQSSTTSVSVPVATSEKHGGYYNAEAQANAPPPAYPVAPPAPTTLAHAVALYTYTPTDAGDLALEPNDRIAVLEYMNNEWWKGRSERTESEGIFPRTYVRVEESKAAGPVISSASTPSGYGNAPLQVSQGGSGAPNAPNGVNRFGKKLGNAAIFGAGATVGSKIVNGIF